MKLFNAVIVALVLAGLSGCASRGDKAGDVSVVDQGSAAEGAAGEGATAYGVSEYGDLSVQALSDPNSPLSQRVIYFAFDSSDVAEQDRDLVYAHAAFLVANPTISVSLEGHADERGSREYNIGLGDHRAQSVRKMLELQGVSPAQISTVSYGEEKPAVEGHDESAWSMNRRVELVYVGY